MREKNLCKVVQVVAPIPPVPWWEILEWLLGDD